MSNSISHTVMRRVRMIHAFRTLAPLVGGAGVFLIAVWGIGREVWVAKVFENMPTLSDVPAVLSFYARAFLATDLFVQLLSILAAGALIALARSFARMVPYVFRTA